MLSNFLNVLQRITFNLIKVIIPFKTEETDMYEVNTTNQCKSNDLSPIKDVISESPWPISPLKSLITPNRGKVTQHIKNDSYAYYANIKTYEGNCNDNQSKKTVNDNLLVKCPKCSYDISLIDTFNLITCNNPLYCKGTTKFCRKCLIMISNTTEESSHFKYGYYKPICTFTFKQRNLKPFHHLYINIKPHTQHIK